MRTALWFIWLAAVAAFTAGNFSWEIAYFRSPGPQFHRLLLILLPVLAVTLAIYLRVRRARFWRLEPVVVTGFLLTALLVYRFKAALVTIWILTACFAFGRSLLQRLRLDPGPPQSAIPISAALGFAALDAALFLLGLAHLYAWWSFAVLLAAPCMLLRREARALFTGTSSLWKRWNESTELREPLAGVAVVFGTMALGATAMVSLAPAIAFDAIHMHLPSARYYVEQHALLPVPELSYSYFPQGGEVLMAVGYALGGQPAAQMLTPLFFALLALLGFRLARDAGGTVQGALFGVAAAITPPVLHWSGSVAKNDLMMGLFELAALSCFLAWRRDGQFRWIQAGVFLVGAAFGIKHVALFGAIPLGAMFAWAAWREPKRVRSAASLLLIFVVFGLYWQTRTFLLTGNPLYPESVQRASRVKSWSRDRSEPKALAAVKQCATSTSRLVFRGEGFFESPLPAPLGIFVAVCWPAWLLAPRRWQRAGTLMAVFVGAYVLYWGCTYPILRYALPALFLLFLLTGSRAADFYQRSGRLVRASILAATSWCFTFTLLGVAIIEINAPQLRRFAGRIDDRTYLQQALVTWDSMQFLGRAASPGDRVLGLDLCQNFYTPRTIRISGFLISQPAELPGGFLAGLHQADYQWLVAPRGTVPAVLAASGGAALTPKYEDRTFAVFHKER